MFLKRHFFPDSGLGLLNPVVCLAARCECLRGVGALPFVGKDEERERKQGNERASNAWYMLFMLPSFFSFSLSLYSVFSLFVCVSFPDPLGSGSLFDTLCVSKSVC